MDPSTRDCAQEAVLDKDEAAVLARIAAASVFRAFSRKENLSSADAQPAVLFLTCLRGFDKVEDDCWSFFAACFTWFLNKRKVFTKANDAEILRLVANRFEAHLGDEERAEPSLIESNKEIVPAVWGEVAPMTEKELEALEEARNNPLASRPALRRRGGASRGELARDVKEIKKESGWLKKLKKKHPELPELFEYHFQRLLEAETLRDPEQRQGYLRALRNLQDALRKSTILRKVS